MGTELLETSDQFVLDAAKRRESKKVKATIHPRLQDVRHVRLILANRLPTFYLMRDTSVHASSHQRSTANASHVKADILV